MTPEQRREQAEKEVREKLGCEGPIKKDSLVRNVQLAIRISLAADGLAEALRSVDPFSGGRDGDMCLWCRREVPRNLTEWAERLDPDNHDADCELILKLAAYEAAKESR